MGIATGLDQTRDAIAGQFVTVAATRPVRPSRYAQPYAAALAMGGECAAAQTTVAITPGIRPLRFRVFVVPHDVGRTGAAIRTTRSREMLPAGWLVPKPGTRAFQVVATIAREATDTRETRQGSQRTTYQATSGQRTDDQALASVSISRARGALLHVTMTHRRGLARPVPRAKAGYPAPAGRSRLPDQSQSGGAPLSIRARFTSP
jgi:hypothetical protein